MVNEQIVVEQKIEFSGATKKQMEENRKNVEKALAKSLGVQTDRVKIIDIIEVKKGRRYLLGSTYVKIIYEVEVEDDTEAKSVEVNMKAINEFKEILNANIKAQSPTLKATVETLEQPVTRRKKIVAKAEDGDNLVNTEDTQSHGPKGRGLWYWAELRTDLHLLNLLFMWLRRSLLPPTSKT